MLIIQNTEQVLPLLDGRVAAGFPSPAGDYEEQEIDLVGYLVRRPAATFVMQVTGNSMQGAGIMDGDYILVDKSITAQPGHIVVAVVGGDMTLKRLTRRCGQYCLVAANPDYPDLPLCEDNPPEIWGVVVGCVRRYG